MSLTNKSQKVGVRLPNAEQELLLTAALSDADSALHAWNRWRQNQNLKLLASDARRLLPLVGHNLNQQTAKIPESATIAEITKLGWAKNQLLFKSIADVARLFNENNIDFLLTKGLPMALCHYPSSALRPMNDGDLLVRLEQFDHAIALLKSNGWHHALEEIPTAAHHAMPFKNAARQEIDVHRFALGECPFSPEDAEFWKAAVPMEIGGLTVLTLNPTDLLFMTCVNSVHSPLRWVVDAVLLMRQNEIDWQRFIEQARKRKLAFVTRMALSYLEERFSAPVPTDVLKALREIPVSKLEKKEYYAWEQTDSNKARWLLRYASYRRIPGAQNPAGFLRYLQLLGDLNSPKEIPRWLLSHGREKTPAKDKD